jgi:hypothetical protein
MSAMTRDPGAAMARDPGVLAALCLCPSADQTTPPPVSPHSTPLHPMSPHFTPGLTSALPHSTPLGISYEMWREFGFFALTFCFG